MKVVAYVNFDGCCARAIEFYENVFGVKAEVFFYKDMAKFDPNYKVEKGKENWIMHGQMRFDDGAEIQFADCDQNGKRVGTNICLQLTFLDKEQVMNVYSGLREGARIICDAQPTFYSPLYAELVDKFGIRWSIMQQMG